MNFKRLPHPTYGNYCGRDLTHAKDLNVDPIDELDAACQLHDYTGDDQAFIEQLGWDLEIKKKPKWRYWYGKAYQRTARFFFKLFTRRHADADDAKTGGTNVG